MNGSLANSWRGIALISSAALIAVLFAWLLSPLPTWSGALKALALSAPAVAPLMGLWRGSRYTYRWATLCVLPYFVVGLTEAVANPIARTWSAVILGLSLAWFVSLIAFLRVTKPASA